MPLDHTLTTGRHVVRGACPHDCPDTCALLTTVENGRAIKVEGAPDHPTTRGTLCTKVARYLDRTVHWVKRVGLDYVKKRVLDDPAGRKDLYDRLLYAVSGEKDPWKERAEQGVAKHEFEALSI